MQAATVLASYSNNFHFRPKPNGLQGQLWLVPLPPPLLPTYMWMPARLLARLQGFPESFPIPDDRLVATHLIGNAVPPPLAAFVISVASGRNAADSANVALNSARRAIPGDSEDISAADICSLHALAACGDYYAQRSFLA